MTSKPPEEGAPQQAASLERLREVTRTLAAGLPPTSLPSAPVPPDAVPKLAADLAARLLDEMSELAAGEPEAEVRGFMLPYQCTGAVFKCDGYYKCTKTHSCPNQYSCPAAVICREPFKGLEGFELAKKCTGTSYTCTATEYKCSNTTHSCSGTFNCPTTYTCSPRFTGLSIARTF